MVLFVRHDKFNMWILILFTISVSSAIFGDKLQEKEFFTLHQFTENLEMVYLTDGNIKTLYDKSKAIPVDLDIDYGENGKHRTFLTIPRFSFGIPYSLAVIVNRDNGKLLNPRTAPYPNYDWHSGNGLNCSGITSAIRTFIDPCWRLWIVDSGQINSIQYCAPQLLAFDLNTDKLVHRYIFSAKIHKPGVSVYSALSVDVEENSNCLRTMVYIADPWGYGLIVYNAYTGYAWRIEHELMQPNNKLKQLNLANDGIFTVSIDPKQIKTERQLYFHALNSFTQIRIPLDVVNNATAWTDGSGAKAFRVMGYRGTQCESEVIDSNGNLYCSLMKLHALIWWKHRTPYHANMLKVVAYSPKQINYITGLKINMNTAGEDEIWALSNNPKFFAGRQGSTTNEIKFQIIGCRIKNLLENRPCSVGI